MSDTTMITEKKSPNPQRVKWRNVAYYDTFEEAHNHRLSLDEGTRVKVRRCGEEKARFVVKIGTSIGGSSHA